MARDKSPERIAQEAEKAIVMPDTFSNEIFRMLFEKAMDIRESERQLNKEKIANRDMLRGFLTQGMLADNEKDLLLKFYPPRKDSELGKATQATATTEATETTEAEVVDIPQPRRRARTQQVAEAS